LSSNDFDQIFEAHAAFVWRCLGALGVRGPDVDDLTQEVFVIVHRRLADLDSEQGVKPWLYGILRRVVLNHRRTLRRRGSRQSPLLEDVPASQFDQHDTLEAQEAAQLLTRVLASMPEEQAEVFVLVEMEQLSVGEVGAALEIPVNTAHSRLRLARARFRAALAERELS
jgi:RNA polymerase sigma-70 factor, ECF subfamily